MARPVENATDQIRTRDRHYRAFVGPPERFDLLGASQFNLLTALGLRE